MTKKQAIRHLAWAIQQSKRWEGYYSGSLHEEPHKRKIKLAQEALRFLRKEATVL